MKNIIFISLVITFFLTTPFYVALAAPTTQSREASLQRQLRCMVCNGQSLAESDAKLAQDMRALIHEKIKNGETDEEILNFLQTSYGDAILMEPPFSASNFLLWGAPFILLSLGLFIAWRANFNKK